jgi:DNA polymerase-3 subunit delta
MTALKGGEIDAFLARPDPARPVILVYGPDAGLVSERARLLARAFVDDPNDPFALVRLDGDEIASDPAKLADAVWEVPLFGGRRAVWVRAGSRGFHAAVQKLTEGERIPVPVVIEAGDLKKNAPLRALAEKSRMAVALPCYADGPREVARLIEQMMAEAGLTLRSDARQLLQQSLGADRALSRREIEKLILHAAPDTTVTLEHVMAVVTDAAAIGLDDVVDAAFGGRVRDLDLLMTRARADGLAAQAIILAAERHAALLHLCRLAMDRGQSAQAAVQGLDRPLHFRRVDEVTRALGLWTSSHLQRALVALGEAVLESRRMAPLADAVVGRALMAVATQARRGSGGR